MTRVVFLRVTKGQEIPCFLSFLLIGCDVCITQGSIVLLSAGGHDEWHQRAIVCGNFIWPTDKETVIDA